MIVIDTKVLVRFFTNDDAAQAARAKELFAKDTTLIVPDVVLSELEYVMRKAYKANREELIKIYAYILKTPCFHLSKEARHALYLFETNHDDVADCLIAAVSHGHRLASFDKKLPQIPGVKKYWK